MPWKVSQKNLSFGSDFKQGVLPLHNISGVRNQANNPDWRILITNNVFLYIPQNKSGSLLCFTIFFFFSFLVQKKGGRGRTHLTSSFGAGEKSLQLLRSHSFHNLHVNLAKNNTIIITRVISNQYDDSV